MKKGFGATYLLGVTAEELEVARIALLLLRETLITNYELDPPADSYTQARAAHDQEKVSSLLARIESIPLSDQAKPPYRAATNSRS